MYYVQRSTYRKQERIVSQRLIETLFGGGQSHSVAIFPLRAVYMMKERQEGEAPAQILISVPKKKFKHAVDRNRVKRQIREAYRKNKSLLEGRVGEEQMLLIAIVWLSDKHFASKEVEKRVISLLKQMTK